MITNNSVESTTVRMAAEVGYEVAVVERNIPRSLAAIDAGICGPPTMCMRYRSLTLSKVAMRA